MKPRNRSDCILQYQSCRHETIGKAWASGTGGVFGTIAAAATLAAAGGPAGLLLGLGVLGGMPSRTRRPFQSEEQSMLILAELTFDNVSRLDWILVLATPSVVGVLTFFYTYANSRKYVNLEPGDEYDVEFFRE